MATISQTHVSHKPDNAFDSAFARACRIAGRLRAEGRDEDDILDSLQRDNRAEGMPLTGQRVKRVARWISTKPAGRSSHKKTSDPTFERWIHEAREQAAGLLSRGPF